MPEREISSFMLIAHSDWKPIFLVETNMTAPHISMIPVKFTSSSYTRWFSRDNWISRNVGGPRHFFHTTQLSSCGRFHLLGPKFFQGGYLSTYNCNSRCMHSNWIPNAFREIISSWWLNQPIWKIQRQNGFIFPKFRVNIKKYLSCHHLVIFWMISPMTPLHLAHHRAVGG